MAFKIALVGEPILASKAVAVSDFADESLTQFISELKETLVNANGVGIAAPQVFDPRAILIIASKANARYPDAPNMPPLVMINPEIIEQSQTENEHWEGCLSVPGLLGFIRRADWVTVKYQNEAGHAQTIRLEGFVARIFLHEYDHLIGQTWLDHINSSTQVMAESLWYEKFANVYK